VHSNFSRSMTLGDGDWDGTCSFHFQSKNNDNALFDPSREDPKDLVDTWLELLCYIG